MTALRSGAGAGLNWGAGGAVPIEVLVCDGSARGAETDAARWRRVGGGGAPLTLPLLSWMDAAPAYGALPLDAPVPLAPGATVGVCVRTGDVQGLALRVDKAQRPPAAPPPLLVLSGHAASLTPY